MVELMSLNRTPDNLKKVFIIGKHSTKPWLWGWLLFIFLGTQKDEFIFRKTRCPMWKNWGRDGIVKEVEYLLGKWIIKKENTWEEEEEIWNKGRVVNKPTLPGSERFPGSEIFRKKTKNVFSYNGLWIPHRRYYVFNFK